MKTKKNNKKFALAAAANFFKNYHHLQVFVTFGWARLPEYIDG